RDLTAGRRQRPGQNLQQRALAGSVAADHAEPLAAGHFEGNVLQRPEVAAVALAEAAEQHLLEPILRLRIDAINLRERGHVNRQHGIQMTSAKPRLVFMNQAYPNSAATSPQIAETPSAGQSGRRPCTVTRRVLSTIDVSGLNASIDRIDAGSASAG